MRGGGGALALLQLFGFNNTKGQYKGIAVCGSCSVVGLSWWASFCCVCLWWFPALGPACSCIPIHRDSLQHTQRGSSFWLPMHASPSRLFVAEGSSLPQTARPLRVDMYVRVCVIVFGIWTVSDAVCFVCSVPARRRCCVWASSRAPGGCPGASVSVVCALRGSLSGPRWVPCRCVCGWCLGGTGCGVMCLWCLG